MPRGRKPIDFNEYKDKIYDLAYKGLSDKKIIENLDISKDTFYRWKSELSEFQDTLKTAREKRLKDNVQEVEDALLKLCKGYEIEEITEENGNGEKGEWSKSKIHKKHIPPNVSAIVFFLANMDNNKYRRTDKDDNKNNNGNDTKPVVSLPTKDQSYEDWESNIEKDDK